MGFEQPTPIQEQAIGPALEGRDVLASAMTGSGKTAAFLLPVMHRLMSKPRGKTRVLILSPTRELAAQIHEHFEELARPTPLTGAAIFGGVGMTPQEKAFRKGVDLIAATPGRLLDHMQNDYAALADIEVLILDEADRMLDMGFLPDVRRVLKAVSGRDQTMLFSATMPRPIVDLSRQILRNPVHIELAREAAPATGIAQTVYPVADDLKPALLAELIRRDEVGNVIAFCRTKHRANRLTEFLKNAKIPAAPIHGNRSQSAREDALAGFKQGRYRVLVATDILARGIDVEALEHVVNVDVPNQSEDYIHRIGRTGRAEATGDALTMVAPDEEGHLRNIERAVGRRIDRIVLEDFDYKATPAQPFEIPRGVRIAEIRQRKREERERAKANAERKAQRESQREAQAKSGGKGRNSEGGSGKGGNRRRRRRRTTTSGK